MAKRTARMPFWGPEPAITPSVALSNELVKQYTRRHHEQIWTTLSSCRQSRACIAAPDRKLTKFYLSFSRDKLRKLVGRIPYETLPVQQTSTQSVVDAMKKRKQLSTFFVSVQR
ncbi:hypothetical protein Zmor_014985 [Zophobas morio]|uniref:Uncharacterized protein n=1 Tax=Zophobas morio TaxID=2755281 RepID=A0AA38IIF1_9CUCU|nr:hypothetical protein Zmor_014985 [Zophobas morio]